MYALTRKLKEYRKDKKLTQFQIADILNMEQTTYAKIENAKSSLRFETALQIAAIIEKEISEFTAFNFAVSNVNEGNLTKSNLNGNDDATNNVPDKIINLFEELLGLVKQHFKAT